MEQGKAMSTEMLLGEIKARLDSLSRQLAVLEDHVSKGHDKLEERVTILERDYNRLKGTFAAAFFVATIIIPLVSKKLGF